MATKRTNDATAVDAPAPAPVTINAVKGFNNDWTCTPNGTKFQYALGQTYTHDGSVVRCKTGGFHAVDYPLAVFGFYAPAGDNGKLNRFADVTCAGEIDRDESDSKVACGAITINFEMSLGDITKRAIAWICGRLDRTKEGVHCTQDRSAASNTGDYSAASNTGYQSAASNTGNYSAASNTGNRSAAEVSGADSVAMASGYQGRARACAGSAIVLCFRDDRGKLLHIRAVIAGSNGIKPDTWYSLDKAGEFVEVAA